MSYGFDMPFSFFNKLVLLFGACVVSGVLLTQQNLGATGHASEYPPSNANWPDCVLASDQYCIELLSLTPPNGNQQVFVDAVPDTPQLFADHPHPYIRFAFNASTNLYGKRITQLTFDIDTSKPEMLGAATRTWIPAGNYKVVVRTGKFKPHSMTIKAKPFADKTFVTTQDSSGNHKLEINAQAAPFVTLMDSEKWQGCRATNWSSNCEADTAFVNRFSGILLAIPPDYVDEMISNVSPDLSLSQGMWFASNTIVWDAKPEMNLVEKSFSLPTYGPHYVPRDFPTDGLVEENGRHLNPAFFVVNIPNTLSSFVANFTMSELAEKLPGIIRATIRDGAGQEVPHAHVTTMQQSGAKVAVSITHFSAPNPKVYMGTPLSLQTSTTSTTTTSSTSVAPALQVKNPSKPLSMRVKKSLSQAAVLKKLNLSTRKTSKVRLTVAKASTRVCKIQKTKVVAMKAGNCKISVTVTTKGHPQKKKSLTIKVTK
jgi:hypothetical protein